MDNVNNWLNRSCRRDSYSTISVMALSAFLTVLVVTAGCRKKETITEAEEAVPLDMGYLLDNREMQVLGELIFFDENLSEPPGQSCATCHGAEAGWSGPDDKINRETAIYPGAVAERFSNRKPPSAAYATFSPQLHAMVEDGGILFVGGNFWDGRATGYILGNAAADQAQQPFLNNLEQNLPDAPAVVARVKNSAYANLFAKVAADIWKIDDILTSDDVNLQFGIVGLAIAAFEHSPKVNAFTSKFDYYLKGEAELTDQEMLGMDLFINKGLCAECHPIDILPDGTHPLFTDFTYDNLGIPANPKNPWYRMGRQFNPDGAAWVDPGLGDFLKKMPQYAMYAGENMGKHRVPTLRNVDKRPYPEFFKAYGHNGYFGSLEEIVHFYNTRDVLPLCSDVADPQPGVNCWPAPEVAANVNTEELGDLKLTPEEEAAIVAFMKTLSDGYVTAKR